MNAKEEFLGHTGTGKGILCAEIWISNLSTLDEDDGEVPVSVETKLTTEFTDEEYEDFLSDLDVNYDSGYGTQELGGTVWFDNGTWLTRWEYDGSEGWQYNGFPDIPENLRRLDREREREINKVINEE